MERNVWTLRQHVRSRHDGKLAGGERDAADRLPGEEWSLCFHLICIHYNFFHCASLQFLLCGAGCA